MKQRLDQAVTALGLVVSRSQAESWVRLGKVFVNGKAQTKPGFAVSETDNIELKAGEQYVSRAALKLDSVAQKLALDFRGKVVLDVGSSTGGFTDYALRHGAKMVIAVEVGKDQLHPSLRANPNIHLLEQTDIRDVYFRSISQQARGQEFIVVADAPDIVLIDVSFVSLRDILPHIASVVPPTTRIVAMVKPQFEAAASKLKHKGVIKNDRMRRDILKDFETWARISSSLKKQIPKWPAPRVTWNDSICCKKFELTVRQVLHFAYVF